MASRDEFRLIIYVGRKVPLCNGSSNSAQDGDNVDGWCTHSKIGLDPEVGVGAAGYTVEGTTRMPYVL